MKFAALALIACGHAAPAPAPAPVPAPAPAADAPAASQDEILAGIQKAMNDLAPAANACWAKAATERFDIAGKLRARIAIGEANVGVEIVEDGTRSPVIASCMTKVLLAYAWAPPLHYQTIELPFEFHAPDGQSVIDRRLVEWHGQGDVSIAVLLDENNTGNAGASMFEVAFKAGAMTTRRVADRAELWYFLGPARVIEPRPTTNQGFDEHRVAAGDMLYVPKDVERNLGALDRDVHAVLVLVPGGREGSARAGALPMRTASASPGSSTGALHVLRASTAASFGPATIYLDATMDKTTPLAASLLQLPPGATVPEHVHAHETELLYLLAGAGTMTVAGTEVPVTATSAIQIPPNTPHAFRAREAVRALQIYTPPGPEQRFKKAAP